MLKGAAIFLLAGISAALLGVTSVAGASFFVAIAGIFVFMFLMLIVVALFATRAA
jgi:uncharacterized membrane protein YtjA (UPF0391 family)